jgi:predicted transposase/invertase (TIGR01784 family)
MAEHDQSYKRLFSHPKMVEDLLRGFVREEWVNQLDFSTLETVKDSFMTDNLKARHDDIIWRVRWGPKWLYIFLLLEFQSTIDPFMAVRLMVYIGLLYQHLIDTQKLKQKDKLPPVLPIVIYNGSDKWDAKRNLSQLIEKVPGGLDKYQPKLRYFLLDESTFSEAKLAPLLKNLVAALIRLENTRNLENEQAVAKAIQTVLDSLVQWLKDPEFERLRRDMVTWLLRVLLPHNVPNIPIPQMVELQEMNSMLYETIQNWYKEAEVRGRAQGEEFGRQQGEALGIQRGRLQGQAEILLLQLETKFGPLEPDVKVYLNHLDSKALLTCSQRLLTAQTLSDVIGQ